ncbi:hypothetical protein WJX81_000300 [Elliptochloris bilobata]|uniref:TIR domain-containing protein n=1 Tax=Elliptochloris bilobata TaxID=381761 RepID=A0AAW1S0Z5_9CHLO
MARNEYDNIVSGFGDTIQDIETLLQKVNPMPGVREASLWALSTHYVGKINRLDMRLGKTTKQLNGWCKRAGHVSTSIMLEEMSALKAMRMAYQAVDIEDLLAAGGKVMVQVGRGSGAFKPYMLVRSPKAEFAALLHIPLELTDAPRIEQVHCSRGRVLTVPGKRLKDAVLRIRDPPHTTGASATAGHSEAGAVQPADGRGLGQLSTCFASGIRQQRRGSDQTCDVFISHRGPDTRNNVESHIERRLKEASLDVFVDYTMGAGDKAWPIMMGKLMGARFVVTRQLTRWSAGVRLLGLKALRAYLAPKHDPTRDLGAALVDAMY